MPTKAFFNRVEELSKEQFLEAWKKEDESNDQNGHHDQSMEDRRREHTERTGLKYYVVMLTEYGLDNLVIGPHNHPPKLETVGNGGEEFRDIIPRYRVLIQNNQTNECLSWLRRIQEELNTEYRKIDSGAKSTYSLGRVFNRPNLAVPNAFHDCGDGKLYAGNFHRFVGYGLWIKEYGYRPIKVYYCEKPLAE